MKRHFLNTLQAFKRSYFALAGLILLAATGIAVYQPAYASADALGCAQMAGTFQSSTKPAAPYNKDDSSHHCVQYIQQMLNGALSYNRLLTSDASTLNRQPLSSVTDFGTSTKGFGSISGVYDAGTASLQTSFQNYINTYPTGLSAATARPTGALPANGTTEGKTWEALCRVTYNMPAPVRTVTSSTDFAGGNPSKAKTNMWYMRSYMRAGYSAAVSAGCKAAVNPPATPGSIATSTTPNKLTVSWSSTSGATTYNVYLIPASKPVVDTTGLRVTHGVYSVATVGAKGWAFVQACNAAGCSPWSAQIAFNFK